MLPKFTERIRAFFYRINTPLGALLGTYGLVSGERWALWVAMAQAILGGSLAIDNTSTSPKEDK